jgi:signal transduction histidine kinase/ligand-binding sensor domain-containing protein
VGAAFPQEYLYDSWEIKDGLPQNTITRILQTSDGYLWIGTEGGLARFDGVRFTNFDVQNTPVLKSNRIAWLHENINGDLFIATRENLVLYQKGKFIDISEKYSSRFTGICLILQVNDSELALINITGEALTIDINTYEQVKLSKDAGVDTYGEHFKLFVPFESLLEKFPNRIQSGSDAQVSISTNNSLLQNIETSEFWAIDEHRLYHWTDSDRSEEIDLSGYYSPDERLRLYRDDASVCVFNSSGSKITSIDLNTKKISIRLLPESCPDGLIYSAYTDRENNLWLASSVCGLIKIKPDRFRYLDPDSLILKKNIYPILRDSKNRILIGTADEGLLVFDQFGQQIENPNHHPSVKKRFVSSIVEYNQSIYFSTIINNFILKWDNQGIATIPFSKGKFTQVNALYVTPSGKFLAGTHHGLYQLTGDSLTLHPLSLEKEVAVITTLYEDEENKLWVLSSLDAFCYDQKNQVTLIDFKERWPHIQDYRGLHSDDEGRMYFGTYGFGLCVLANDSLHQITIQHGLKENVVSSITEDSKGNIWLTGNQGLTRIRKSELLELLMGEKQSLSSVIFNERSDALRSGEFNGGIQQAKCHLGGERYIFPSLKGAVLVDFENMMQNTLAPPVHIERMQYGDTIITALYSSELEFTGERAEFYFTALSFVAPEKVKFKYQLAGYDKTWIDGGSERKAVYSKLPPGNYNFRVIASNDEDVWNMNGASYSFSILPPFYMTWWFRTLLIFTAIVLTIALVRWYVLRGQKIQRDKSAMLDILPDLVFKLDKEGNYLEIYGNPSELVAPANQLKNRNIKEFLHESFTEKVLSVLHSAIETQEMQRLDYDQKSSDGKKKYFEGRFIAIDKKEVLCIMRDTTENRLAEVQIRSGETKLRKALEKEKKLLKKLNEQQKVQLEAIIDTEEKERRRIAADLHDGLGQLLSSVKINLGVASDKLEEKKIAETKSLVHKSQTAIDLIANELRNISYNLLPPSLEQFGLASAIEEEVLKLSIDTKRKIYFDHALTDVKFDQRLEVVIFRVFQELINNAIKHANADEITLQLIQHDHEIVFMIEDNGVGFDFEKSLIKKNSSGLKNLRSRINLIKGKISIDSRPGSGTSVIIKIPI